MNRPDCPGHVPDYPSLPLTGPQTFKVSADPLSACWTSDPLPEGNVRAYRDIPADAIFIPFGVDAVLVDGCDVPECLNCPECCGSRTMPNRCGQNSDPPGEVVCCECGDDYTLTLTETMRASGVGTHYADPCTVFPAIGHTQPTWDIESSRTATFHFGCEEVDDGNGGTFLRRKVTGVSVARIVSRRHRALIEYHFPVDQNDTCYFISAGVGRTEVLRDETFTRTWEELGIGAEGCGLTRRAAAYFGPGVNLFGTLGAVYGVGLGETRYDVDGECSGSSATWTDGCDPSLGGEFAIACRFGVSRVGSEVVWAGDQECRGGSFTESGTYTAVGQLPATVVVNGLPPSDTDILGAESGTWEYTQAWGVSGGRECQQDPCTKQEPIGLAKTRIKGEKSARSLADGRGGGSVLDRALNAKAGGCNCGKR